MTRLLKEAFEQASKLPVEEQDALARTLLEDLESEERWDSTFGAAEDVLSELADEALSEHRAGRTEPLDLDRL